MCSFASVVNLTRLANMSYVPLIEDDFDLKPNEYFAPCEYCEIEFMLGAFIESESLVKMSVFLVRDYTREDLKIYDLRFGTFTQHSRRSYLVTPVDFSYSSSNRYVLKSHRQHVMALVCRCIEALVNFAVPDIITMHTFHANLPSQGMLKYAVIGACLEQLKFDIKDTFMDADGRTWWQYVRKPCGDA